MDILNPTWKGITKKKPMLDIHILKKYRNSPGTFINEMLAVPYELIPTAAHYNAQRPNRNRNCHTEEPDYDRLERREPRNVRILTPVENEYLNQLWCTTTVTTGPFVVS